LVLAGTKLLQIDVIQDAAVLKHLTEVAVIISLFTAGLQLRLPLDRIEWRISLRSDYPVPELDEVNDYTGC
jgi:hypothetical protein